MDANQYAAWKEIYLGRKCQVQDDPKPWQFWMIMIKSGNMDTLAAVCPRNGEKARPFPPEPAGFPCFGPGCMNMPLITALMENDTSYHEVSWEKEVGKGSWNFRHILKTSSKYPWLMLYLRSDATVGYSGGYHYQTRGCSKWGGNGSGLGGLETRPANSGEDPGPACPGYFQTPPRRIPKSPDFTVRFTLDIKQGGGPKSQFYLMDIGSCWKNNGQPCNGDVTTDVTRYSEMIINPGIGSWCNPTSLASCPPYHTLPNGTRVLRSDKENFPYEAYHIYCSPGNAEHPEEPYNFCDPYSNPQPQEILQILPHPVWGEYGYPTKKGEGWIGDPRTWELDVGRLSQALYFYQDPGSPPAKRYWSSVNLGTEIYMDENQVAEWSVRDFDIIVPNEGHDLKLRD
ncbi:UNVERIFIED_CONTAM: hypothetical protein Sradi_5318600 [Sesamum radiatum]|uniref:DUF7705 domain-containing protein n=1 Tax=Sesamum radiatum TaxID=300843 RepID=A0AAW2LQW3_SESRA